MIRLTIKKTPVWLDLPAGVRVHVRPLTTAVAQAAQYEAIRRSAAEQTEAQAMADAGQPLDAVGFTAANRSALVGNGVQWEIEALARFGIIAWEGVANDDGEAMPWDVACAEALAQHQALGPAFRDAYRAAFGIEELDAEKNGHGRLPSGEAKAAPETATAAQESL
jgi:plastocyanin